MVSAAPAASEAAKTAAAIGRAAGRMALGSLRGPFAKAAVANGKVLAFLLISGVGFTLAVTLLPILMIVFAMSAGISHGVPLAAPAPVRAAGPPLAAGELACPVPGAVLTQPFGPSELPGEPAMFGYAHFHTGLDLAAPAGTPIHAAEGGQVLQAAGQTNSLGMLVGYGNLVRIVATDGRIEYYGHMSAFAVSPGQLVEQSQTIGYVGSTGYSTGPHVHFEVRVNGTPVDSSPFMQRC